MKQAFQYKLLPNTNQGQEIERWLSMLRYQYNYLLAERFNWWQYNRSDCVIPQGATCQIACTVGSPILRDNPDWHSQSASLPQLKTLRPWYKNIYSQVLQDCVKRVKLAFERYIKGDSSRKRSGKPRFKGRNRYRTFTFPQAKDNWLQRNKIKLPKLGLIKYICHRPIESGFHIKTASITKKADGYYLTLIVEDQFVPEFEPDIIATENNSIAIDLGLEKLYVDSLGNQVLPQKYLRKSSEKLALLQRKLADNNRSRKARKLIRRAIARLHLKIARQRKQWHFEEAKKLCLHAEVICIEDLKIANLRRKNKANKVDGHYVENGQCCKAGLNKSFSDCAIAQFVDILQHQAQKLGVKILKINPRNTSQTCPICLNKVSKTLSDRWHNCPTCKASMDRDYASALLIKKVALDIVSL
ncbi:MAG: RNA-guided endonuclease InsQ/TnpB family protein [Waterburya sp.]